MKSRFFLDSIRALFCVACCMLACSLLCLVTPASAEGPAFDCSSVVEGSIEALICQDAELSALDRTLATVYPEAAAIDEKAVPSNLKAEQRGWIKGRDDCWKSEDKAQCVKNEYQRRIAELQARYRLLSPTSTIFYSCENNPANEVVVNYFATEPQTAIAERGDSSFLLFSTKEKGRFTGGNETIIVSDDSLRASFGYQAPFLECHAQKKIGGKPAGLHPSWDRDGDGLNDCENDGSCDHTIDYSQPRS